ncbi:Na+/H+ antiporter NhaA [Motilimonas cestriensis]|uniref:Na(+)/H(+) antiporter NhaA n=1 Tax=Motilimonas cestriensis TaxID=2742685 RepID=A0ABS8WH34_9GAMM|nr:Na+/H+ antiporter NhaA [Motilimonas cestriensis]MCE2597033.1 Na+/H+ antiporter NhaA [Motilimonas cestriensis]
MAGKKMAWLHSPITGGALLVAATLAALLWANLAPEHYHHFWHATIWQVGAGAKGVHSINLHAIANEFLMAIFFFFIGLEIKRELLDGELSSVKKAALPVVAALGGVILPVIIYLAFNGGSDTARGWGVPMATDIAFALGVLALVGSRAPLALKVFLSALAIGDDLMAVLVIAIFYTSEINFNELLYGLIGLAILGVANRFGVRKLWVYYVAGLGIVWMGFLASGVHATIAGVAVAFTVPSRRGMAMNDYLDKLKQLMHSLEADRHDKADVLSKHAIKTLRKIKRLSYEASNPLQIKEKALHPFATLFIVPVFALGNAGIPINQEIMSQLLSPIALGVGLGLLVGKPLGIYLFTRALVALGIGSLPEGITWRHIIGAGFLAGMGFTMSIFITDLAFVAEVNQLTSKMAVLIASIISGVIGYTLLTQSPKVADK